MSESSTNISTTAEESEKSEVSQSPEVFNVYTIAIALFSLLFLFVFNRRRMRDWKEKQYASFLNDFKTMYNNLMGERKAKLFNSLRDTVSPGSKILLVEVGSGSGANFKYFPDGTRVICVDPNRHFEKYIAEETKKLKRGVELEEFKVGAAEDMFFLATDSVDVVVSTLVLWSVNDVMKSLGEIRRILKPGGRFYFLEHVSEKNSLLISALQILVSPIWAFLLECNIRSKAHIHIEKAGFSKVEAEYFHADELDKWSGWFGNFAPLLAPHYCGYAVK